MKILKLLNNINLSILIFYALSITTVIAENQPIDIWNLEKKENNSISDTNVNSKNVNSSSQNNIYKMQVDKKITQYRLIKTYFLKKLKL